MSGYLARNPLMTDEPQFGPPPVVAGRPVLPNALAMPAGDWRDTVAPQPSAADAADATRAAVRAAPGAAENAMSATWRAYTDFLARDRAEQVRLGYVDPTTGERTPEGWRAQAQTIAGGFGPADIGMATGLLGTIKTYHGSPHLFEPTPKNPLGEFRLDKIGTGEGSQVFGQGMYTAEAERVAREGYRDKLSSFQLNYGPARFATFAHDTGTPGAADAAMDITDRTRAGMDPAQALQDAIAENRQKAAAWANRRPPGLPADATDVYARLGARHTNAADWLETLDPAKLQAGKGHMYEVNLNAEPEDFLHWDKRLSEQSPKVQQILSDKFGLSVGKNIDPTGGAIYEHSKVVPGQYRDPVAAAAALRDAGIPGIRYLDRGSRGGDPNAPDATHNYAVWSPEIMEIVRRYGIAGLIGGGAAATAAGGQKDNTQ